jgi:hypothetical protein
MKSIIRLPTNQFAYIECEFEGTEQEIIDKHNELTDLYNVSKRAEMPLGEGLDTKTWNRTLEEYLNTGSVVDGTNLYEQMSTIQKTVMQEIKKCFKRMEAHESVINDKE